MDRDFEKMQAMQASQINQGGIGQLKTARSPDVRPDTMAGMVQMLDHPIMELENIEQRLRDLANRLVGQQPQEVPGPNTNGQIAGSLMTLFGEKHSHLARLCSSVQREITRLDGAI